VPLWVLRVLIAARRIPWRRVVAAVIWLGTVGREYWDRLTADERKELLDLIWKSKGRRSNLTKKEQNLVVDLLDKIRRPDQRSK
jgi:hypothetical protein